MRNYYILSLHARETTCARMTMAKLLPAALLDFENSFLQYLFHPFKQVVWYVRKLEAKSEGLWGETKADFS